MLIINCFKEDDLEKRSALSKVLILIADILIFLICVGGVYHIVLKAGLPFKTYIEKSTLIVSENPAMLPDIIPGDRIISIDNQSFEKWEEAELYLDGKSIGDNVYLELNRNGITNLISVQLTNYYTLFDLIIICIVGITFFGMGVFVRLKAPENSSAQLFH